MSKPSTAPPTKPVLPSRSAWSRGPPQSTQTPSRSQSPAPAAAPVVQSHSRRPSALGQQGVPIKEGVTIPRGNASAIKPGSVVTFGSIDDDPVPISSSPAAAPTLKSEGVKSFGSLPASTPPAQLNGKPSRPTAVPAAPSSSTPTPPPPSKPAKVDIKKLFQNPSSAPPSSAPSDTSSPSLRNASLPAQSTSQIPPAQAPPSQQPHSYQPFVPSAARPPASAARPPSSPSYPRQIPNGNGPRPPGGPNPGSSQIPSGLSSPRMAPHPHPGAPPNPMPPAMPPQIQQMPVPGWPGYYYPDQQPYLYGWYPPPGPQMPGPPHQHPHQPPHPGPHGPPHNGIPMSPHTQPPPLQPGTPTQAHAVPSNMHAPHQPPHTHSHTASSGNMSFTSPPPTPSTATTRLSANSSTFIPGSRPSKIVLKNADGLEVDINSITKSSASASPSPGPRTGLRQPSPGSPAATPRRPTSVRLESEEQRLKRLAEEEKKKEDSKAKAEAEEKAKKEKEEKERERKQKEEEERVKKEEERLKKEEEERLKKEEEERKKKEEEERIKREEEERKQREKEERKAKEEAERKAKEEEERKAKEEEERKAREEAEKKQKEEEERIRREAEAEKERLRLEEEEAAAKAKAEAEAAAATAAESTPAADETNDAEDGEVVEAEQETQSPALSESIKDALRISTADLPKRPRPGALNLADANITNEKVSAALPSALSMAKSITNFEEISYPEGIQSPDPNLNRSFKDGLLRYDRPFLLQFMEHCKEKPEGLPDLVTMGLEPNSGHPQDNFSMSRGGSGRHKNNSGSVPSRQGGQLGLGISGFGKPGQSMFPAMGTFGSGSKLTSDERFAASTRAVSAGGNAYGRPSPMTRTSSQGGVGGTPMSSNRVRSKRGEKRGEGNKAGRDGYGHGQSSQPPAEPVAPLEVSANRWDRKAIGAQEDKKALVDRKVKALLNKLTMEKFDSISDQIVEWANRSDGDNDGKTLMQVIALVFEKATDEATWSEMYARLCRKMMEKLSPAVRDDSIKMQDGRAIAGGQLFRKYLLNRCQDEFERGWAMKEATAAAAAKKAAEDQAVRAANEKEGNTEVALYSDEYYAAQKAKRRGLGLIKFIGELFKLQMLTERIMHTCLKKLLGNVDQPEEEDLESCCKLLMTIGSMLDSPKAANHMMAYFSRITELRNSPLVTLRVQFMLQDVLDLREKKWVNRNVVAAPSTIAQVHENAAKEKAAQEKDAYSRQISMSRGGSRRGGNRDDYPQVGPDGWAVAGGGNAPRPPSKAGDLSNFGKINKTPSMSFGPSTVFSKKGGENKRESVSRSSSSSNMFSMLSQGDMSPAEPKAPEPQRKRLVLAPRTKPTTDEVATKSESEADAESEAEAEPSAVEMSEEQANKKIEEDLKEFFAVRNLDEAEVYLTNLPAVHHFRLIDKFTSRAIESKEAEATLLAGFFARAVEKELVTPEAFQAGFLPIAEIIDDVTIDAPKALTYFATVVKSAGLDDERKALLASKSLDEQKLLGLLS